MEVLAALAIGAGAAYLLGRKPGSGSSGSTDSLPPLGATSYPHGLQDLARAIAYAEGFFTPGTAPNRANNPGAIKVPGWTGPVTGTQGISVFNSPDDGWNALYRQLDLIDDGRSSVYSESMTISEMAQRWTNTNQSAWAANVASSLGVSTSTRLWQVLA